MAGVHGGFWNFGLHSSGFRHWNLRGRYIRLATSGKCVTEIDQCLLFWGWGTNNAVYTCLYL